MVIIQAFEILSLRVWLYNCYMVRYTRTTKQLKLVVPTLFYDDARSPIVRLPKEILLACHTCLSKWKLSVFIINRRRDSTKETGQVLRADETRVCLYPNVISTIALSQLDVNRWLPRYTCPWFSQHSLYVSCLFGHIHTKILLPSNLTPEKQRI